MILTDRDRRFILSNKSLPPRKASCQKYRVRTRIIGMLADIDFIIENRDLVERHTGIDVCGELGSKLGTVPAEKPEPEKDEFTGEGLFA